LKQNIENINYNVPRGTGIKESLPEMQSYTTGGSNDVKIEKVDFSVLI